MAGLGFGFGLDRMVIAGGSAIIGDWILETGFWADSGVWKDSSVWID